MKIATYEEYDLLTHHSSSGSTQITCKCFLFISPTNKQLKE